MGSVLSATDQAVLDAVLDRVYTPAVMAARARCLVQTIVHTYCSGREREVAAWVDRVTREGRPVASWPGLRDALRTELQRERA